MRFIPKNPDPAMLSCLGCRFIHSAVVFPTPHPPGERVRRSDSDLSMEPQPSPLAGEDARGTRAGEGARCQRPEGCVR
jgi:hypothetical protein